MRIIFTMVEVLQAYSNRGRHYETRFDRILEAGRKSTAGRKPRNRAVKSSARLVHRLTSTQVDEMTDRYQQGWSSRRLAEAYNVSKTSIVMLLREAGIPIRRQGLIDSDADNIVERYATGASLAAIGKIYDVSADTVRKLLIRQGITRRSPWEHPL